MGNRTRKLNPAQAAALDRVAQQDQRRRAEIPLIRAKAREQERRDLEAVETATALAVRQAFTLGTPKAHIMRALTTSDYATVTKWLKRTEALEDATVHVPEPFEILTDGVVRLTLPHYDTAAPSPDNYPAVLTGLVRRGQGGTWQVVEDPGTEHTDLGDLPGWLTWEIQRPTTAPKSLPALLDEWWAR